MKTHLLLPLAALAVALCGCGPVSSAQVPATPSAPAQSVQTTRVADGDVAGWRFREFELPGSWSVEGQLGRVALLQHNTRDDKGTRELQLLDLESGRRRAVRNKAVNQGLLILGAHLGDGWIAWEEVPPNDLERDPKTVVWSLYAARYDTATLDVEEPRLVLTSTADRQSRPLFGFDGRVLYVAVNSRASDGATSSAIESFDLDAGGRRVFLRPSAFITSIGVSKGSVVVVTEREATAAVPGSRLTVADTANGRSRLVFDPPRGRVVHPASFHDGWLAWAAVLPGVGGTTEIYLRGPSGRIQGMTLEGNDAGIAGAYAIAEASEPNTESIRTKSYAPGGQVFVMRLGAERRSCLVEGLIEQGFWWQMAEPAEYRSDRLVVYADGTLLGARPTTLVRAYDVPSGRTSRSAVSMR